MNDKTLTIYNAKTCVAAQNQMEHLFKEYGYVVVSWKAGPLTSMPQKALIHIWLRQVVAAAYRKPADTVTLQDMESIKRSMKARYYLETSAAWMVHTLADPFSPDKQRIEYTSIAAWGTGECYAFMEWLQLFAAERLGLVLESKGEFSKLKQRGKV